MVNKDKKNSDHAGFYLLLALGVSSALALVFGPAIFIEKHNAGTLTITHTGNTPVLSETIGRLSTSESPSQRMNAARWLSTHYETSPDEVIKSLSSSLSKDADPVVRAQAATSIGNVARQAREKSTLSTKQQEQIAELLHKQYHVEASDAVRRCIISAASELDIDAAGSLVDKAISDNDPSVKEEALRARVERERRAQLKKLG